MLTYTAPARQPLAEAIAHAHDLAARSGRQVRFTHPEGRRSIVIIGADSPRTLLQTLSPSPISHLPSPNHPSPHHP